MRILVAPDKFRGTATAMEVASAIALAAHDLGHLAAKLPMADGGEGTLEALGGATETSVVTGPDGQPRQAPWRLSKGTAVIEMARASGLALMPEGANDPMTATSTGTGELIAEAFGRGAHRVVVTLGGSAATDGGRGAVDAIGGIPQGAELVIACDVETRFTDAARVFGPQKGATPAQVLELTARLEALADEYAGRFGRDVTTTPGAGAAGGLAGGLIALGGTVKPGFDFVADTLDLDASIAQADLVITGEGLMDAQSFRGKVVGGITDRARALGVPVAALVGHVASGFTPRIPYKTLLETVELHEAMTNTPQSIRRAAKNLITEICRTNF